MNSSRSCCNGLHRKDILSSYNNLRAVKMSTDVSIAGVNCAPTTTVQTTTPEPTTTTSPPSTTSMISTTTSTAATTTAGTTTTSTPLMTTVARVSAGRTLVKDSYVVAEFDFHSYSNVYHLKSDGTNCDYRTIFTPTESCDQKFAFCISSICQR